MNSADKIRKTLLIVAVVFMSSVAARLYLPLVRVAENWVSDLRVATLSPAEPQNDDIVVVTITEQTLRALPYRTPIDRSFLKSVVDDLEKKQVRAIAIDLLFDLPTEPDKDTSLFDTLQGLETPVVVASAGVEDGLDQVQVEYLHNSLAGVQNGLAAVIKSTADNVVRDVVLRRRLEGEETMGLVAALASKLGIVLPDQDSLGIRFWYGPDRDTPPFRVFEAQVVKLLPAEWFAGKIVLIGVELDLEDRHETPLTSVSGTGNLTPGVIIHAYALAQLLDGTQVHRLTIFQEMLFVLFICLLGAGLFASGWSVLLNVAIGCGLLVAIWAAGFAGFTRFGFLAPIVLPSFGLVASAGIQGITRWNHDLQQKKFIRNAFSKFLSPEVVTHLTENPEQLRLSGEKRQMTFLFSDIAGFTTLSEELDPEKLVEILNQYLYQMCSIVIQHEGTIDKIVGDALVVIFNAPLEQVDHRQRALECALDLDKCAESIRADLNLSGVELGVTRIGVHTGDAIVGNFGGEDRFDYTAMGDAVNTAARLEGANKTFGTRICVSEATVIGRSDRKFRPIGKIVLKGKTLALEVFEPLSNFSQSEMGSHKAYLDAYERLDDDNALETFNDLVKKYPDDYLAKFHCQRLRSGESGKTIVMRSK